jgi:hypothetical protein
MKMKFAQRKAGNAHGWPSSCLGMTRTPARSTMPRRSTLQTIALGSALVLVLLPAGAHASDPLLSGYAGPGGGEQVVLGGATVGGGGGGSDSGGSGGAVRLRAQPTPAAGAGATTPASGTASSNTTRKPQRKKSSSSASKKKTHAGTSAKSTKTATTATLVGAPAVVAYPSRSGAVSGLPVSAVGVLLGVLGLAALVLAGLGLRRLSAGGVRSPTSPQVSGR